MDLLKTYGLFGLAALAALAGIVLNLAGPAEYAIFGWTAAAVLGAAGVVPLSARWGTLAGAAVAAGASGYLFWLKIRPSEGPAICSVNATIDCESINDSAWSVIFGGSSLEIPITLLGLGYFLGLAAATLWAPKQAPRLYQVSAIFALFNVAVTLYLASILVVETKICIFCIAIYLSNLVVLWAAFRGLKLEEQGLFADLGDLASSRSLWTVGGLFVLTVVGGRLASPDPTPEDPLAALDTPTADGQVPDIDLTQFYAPIPGTLELDGTEPAKGPADARYTVVEFADYACPHCAHAGEVMDGWIPQQDDVRLLFKVFPLTKECNPAIPQDNPSNFPPRCVAAVYAECALQQGRFWDVNHDIFANQRMLANAGFPVGDMNRLAQNRGMDLARLEACLEASETFRGVGMDAMAGARAGVQGTPAFFVKGVTDDGSWVMTRQGADDVINLITAHRRMNPAPTAGSDEGEAAGDDQPAADTDTPAEAVPEEG